MSSINNQSVRKTTEQIRAKFAFDKATLKKGKKEYCQKAQGITPDILNNGLLQTFAMYNTDTNGKLIVSDVQDWLFSEICNFGWGEEKKATIIETLCGCPSEKYRRAQVETLAFITWLKRFTKANEGGE